MPLGKWCFSFYVITLTVSLWAQSPADRAYSALKVKDYDTALAAFRQAIADQPKMASLRKDFAYTLLKIGEREEARDQFEAVLRLEPADDHTALEYAFLCYETKKELEARRTFDRLRRTAAQPETRKTAAEAFENIDRPLRQGIQRWSAAVHAAPDQWSAHEELARLAEQHDDQALAAGHYLRAWQLRPEHREWMLDLARVWRVLGKEEESKAILLAASRSDSPRLAETAKEQLPARYPYAYEFEAALRIDPDNARLRREFGFFLLELKCAPEAIEQFRLLLARHPDDELARRQLDLLEHPDRPVATRSAVSAKEMGRRSYEKGYLNDALRYLRVAQEEDPSDAETALWLARTYNLVGRDTDALRWLDRARKMDGSSAAREAGRDYRSLRATAGPFRLTTWALPFYSSRWHNGLLYGQVKGEFRVGRLPLRPYLSLRLIADTRGASRARQPYSLLPAYLSESAAILGVGVGLPMRRGLYAWAEAGEALSYLGRQPGRGVAVPDYRGGLAWLRGWGALLGRAGRGWFAETGADAVYVSRFRNDFLVYAQNRTGRTLPLAETLQAQLYFNWNVTFDTSREYWANFAEVGPGVRVRWSVLPPGLTLRADLLRGAYFLNRDNPIRPNYWDLRAGFWYAFTH